MGYVNLVYIAVIFGVLVDIEFNKDKVISEFIYGILYDIGSKTLGSRLM